MPALASTPGWLVAPAMPLALMPPPPYAPWIAILLSYTHTQRVRVYTHSLAHTHSLAPPHLVWHLVVVRCPLGPHPAALITHLLVLLLI
jgi:hypothetical protein